MRKTLNFVCCNQRRYQKKELNADEINDLKYLFIPLFQAERAWGYAMQLKQEANTDPRKKFHVVNRLRKAIKHSIELEKLSLKFDARTKLEAGVRIKKKCKKNKIEMYCKFKGYNAWMNGQFFFEVEKWDESLKYFNIAK